MKIGTFAKFVQCLFPGCSGDEQKERYVYNSRVMNEHIHSQNVSKVCPQGAQGLNRRNKTSITAGRLMSLLPPIQEHFSLWWHVTKAGFTVMIQRLRDRVPNGIFLTPYDSRKPMEVYDKPLFRQHRNHLYPLGTLCSAGQNAVLCGFFERFQADISPQKVWSLRFVLVAPASRQYSCPQYYAGNQLFKKK